MRAVKIANHRVFDCGHRDASLKVLGKRASSAKRCFRKHCRGHPRGHQSREDCKTLGFWERPQRCVSVRPWEKLAFRADTRFWQRPNFKWNSSKPDPRHSLLLYSVENDKRLHASKEQLALKKKSTRWQGRPNEHMLIQISGIVEECRHQYKASTTLSSFHNSATVLFPGSQTEAQTQPNQKSKLRRLD